MYELELTRLREKTAQVWVKGSRYMAADAGAGMRASMGWHRMPLLLITPGAEPFVGQWRA